MVAILDLINIKTGYLNKDQLYELHKLFTLKPLIIILKIILLFQAYNSYAVYFKLSDYNSGGRIVSLDINGDFVYTAKYDGLLEIINISDPEQPQLVGSIQIPDNIPGVAGRIIFSDTMAFILGQTDIHVVNVTHSSNPVYVGSLGFGKASDIIISNNLAYIAGYYNFQILDISDIQSPQLLGSLYGQLDGICLKDTLIYGVHSSSPNNLRIIDVADQQNPILLSNFDLPIGSSADIAFSNFYVYIVNSNHFWSINVVDPANPVMTDTLIVEDYTRKIYIQEDKAIINHSRSGIKVIDISDPSNLTALGYYDTPGISEQVVVSDNIAYVADSYSGLQIIDITDNDIPYLVSSFQTSSWARGMDVYDDFLYLADGSAGLDVIDISNVFDPVLTGTYFHGIGSSDNVSILNNKLCFSRDYMKSELLFIDITIPYNPILLHQVDLTTTFPTEPTAIFQTDSHVFVGDENTLRIYDIADFSNPVMIATYTTPAPITDVIVANNKAYISIRENGIEIINLENINSPQFLGSYNTPGDAEKITLQSDILIVADGESGFQILDVSNPASPNILESIKPHDNSNIKVKPLIVNNKMVIIDNEWNEIFTYNISDFNNIELLSSLRLNAEIYRLIYHADLFLCSINYYGMIMLENSAILSVNENKNYNDDRNDFNIYPNPFKFKTTISYILKEKLLVNIEIFNQSGMKIKSLINEFKDAGVHKVTWDGTDVYKKEVSSGFYIVNIRHQKKNEMRKILLIR